MLRDLKIMTPPNDSSYLASFHNLGLAMQATLRTGAELLAQEARDALRQSLAGGIAQAQGRLLGASDDAQPDLYFTLFAQWLCEALEVPADTVRLSQALEQQPAPLLDPIHRACHACLASRLRVHRRWRRLRLLGGLPRDLLAGFRDPYALFIAALTMEQCGWRPPWFALAWWAPWNWGTTPQAAAILAVQSLAGAALNRGKKAQAWLLDQRVVTGGFRASPAAPGADLLSTATAALALALAGWQETPDESRLVVDFVASCRSDDGLWSGHPHRPSGDVEYTFYALLALGATFARSAEA